MAKRPLSLLAAVAAAVLLAGGAVAASAPVAGTMFGQVTSAAGSKLAVASQQAPKGTAAVTIGKATVVTKTVSASVGAITKGACVVVVGQKGTNGTVAAQRVTLQNVPRGSTCGAGRRPGGRPPGGARPSGSQAPPNRPPGGPNGGFASGTVTSAKSGSFTIRGRSGSTAVTVATSTPVTKSVTVGASAIHVKDCVFIRGTSSDGGNTVAAQGIQVTSPVGGKCTQGFPGRPQG